MSDKSVKIVHYVILSMIAIAFVLPLIWVLVASVDSNANQFLKWPTEWTFSNYGNVLFNTKNLKGFGIGLVIAGIQSVIVVIVSGLAAYPLSRYKLSYKKGLMYAILFMTALPMIAVIVPVYKMFLNMGPLDTIPVELEEAAWVDGATTMQSIRKIVSSLMFPGICVVFIYTFSGSWGNFFIPYILLSSAEKQPVSVLLYQFFGQHGSISYGPLAAFSVIYALPSVLLYILSQNYMSKGFTMSGAAKG